MAIAAAVEVNQKIMAYDSDGMPIWDKEKDGKLIGYTCEYVAIQFGNFIYLHSEKDNEKAVRITMKKPLCD